MSYEWPMSIKHRSGCAAWVQGRSQQWHAGDEHSCDCGARVFMRSYRESSQPKCDTCVHLTPFEMTDELFTCPVVNIRIHRESATFFGCNQHEAKDIEIMNEITLTECEICRAVDGKLNVHATVCAQHYYRAVQGEANAESKLDHLIDIIETLIENTPYVGMVKVSDLKRVLEASR